MSDAPGEHERIIQGLVPKSGIYRGGLIAAFGHKRMQDPHFVNVIRAMLVPDGLNGEGVHGILKIKKKPVRPSDYKATNFNDLPKLLSTSESRDIGRYLGRGAGVSLQTYTRLANSITYDYYSQVVDGFDYNLYLLYDLHDLRAGKACVEHDAKTLLRWQIKYGRARGRAFFEQTVSWRTFDTIRSRLAYPPSPILISTQRPAEVSTQEAGRRKQMGSSIAGKDAINGAQKSAGPAPDKVKRHNSGRFSTSDPSSSTKKRKFRPSSRTRDPTADDANDANEIARGLQALSIQTPASGTGRSGPCPINHETGRRSTSKTSGQEASGQGLRGTTLGSGSSRRQPIAEKSGNSVRISPSPVTQSATGNIQSQRHLRDNKLPRSTRPSASDRAGPGVPRMPMIDRKRKRDSKDIGRVSTGDLWTLDYTELAVHEFQAKVAMLFGPFFDADLSDGHAASNLITFERRVKLFIARSEGYKSDELVSREILEMVIRCTRRIAIAVSQQSEAIDNLTKAVVDRLGCGGPGLSFRQVLVKRAPPCDEQSDMAYREYVYFQEGMAILAEGTSTGLGKLQEYSDKFKSSLAEFSQRGLVGDVKSMSNVDDE